MRTFQIAFFYLLFSSTAIAQEPRALTIESSGYAFSDERFDFGEFSVSYPLDTTTEVILKGFHEKTPIFEVFRSQLLLRKKMAKKWYGVGGVQYEWDLTSIGNEVNIRDERGDLARKELLIGLEYEPKENMFMQAGFKQLISNPKFIPRRFTNPSAGRSVYFGSKWKF